MVVLSTGVQQRCRLEISGNEMLGDRPSVYKLTGPLW
jgi:hypothetical protein